jgi:hypothetical protein
LSLTSAALGFVLLFLFSAGASAEDDLTILFKTSPPLEQLRPFAEPATLTVLVTSADGRPVPDGSIAVALHAPQHGRFFSTDMPLVEGTRLFDMTLPLKAGKAEWKYLFPIRGSYSLTIDYVGSATKQARKVFEFKIPEKRAKWALLAGFVAGLFALGFAAARIFSGPAAPKSRTAAVMLLFGMLVPLNAAEQSEQTPASGGTLQVAPARVGRPVPVRWRFADSILPAQRPVALTLAIEHLEESRIVFAFDRIAVGREFAFNFHFTDGAEYRIIAVADLPDGRRARTQQEISVTPVEPPGRAAAPALAFFLLPIVAGLAAGRLTR